MATTIGIRHPVGMRGNEFSRYFDIAGMLYPSFLRIIHDTQRCIAYVFWTDQCWLKWFVLFSSWRGNVEHTLRWRCFRRNTTDIGSDRYQTTTTTSLQAQDRRCLQLITTSKYSINGQTNYPLYNAEDLCFSIYFELFMVSRTIRVINYYSITSLTIGVIIYYSKISQTICYSKLHLRSE